VLRGREAVYQVKIQELKEKTLPAFDEDMAQKLAQTSVEELKNRVRENIIRDKKQRAESEQVKELLDQLKAAVSFELPESAVENQTERAVFDIVKENQMRGIPDTMLEEHKADIYKAAQASALEQVKIGFILSKISEIESIKAEAADVIQVIQSYAAQEKMAVDKMIKQLRENNGIEQIEEEIRNRKTVQFLLQSAIME
jgi:trigger factor